MNMEKLLCKKDIEWLNTYAEKVDNTFSSFFRTQEHRFRNWALLVDRFKTAIGKLLCDGRSFFRAVDEAHNELCISNAILVNPNPRFVSLEYEPILSSCRKLIDFRASSSDGFTAYVDVKTIKPISKDRWDQFDRAVKEGWFPDNIEVMISEESLGGELWHNMFAARSRMLEYAIELEQKIAECKPTADNTIFVLALCGDGFYWHEDELEDFVHFYYSGFYRHDDPFSKVEAHYVTEKKITLAKSISRFAYMRRPQGELYSKRLNWNVRPPAKASLGINSCAGDWGQS